MEALNIWYGAGENIWLSNLAERKFKDKLNRSYLSVEHAYQTLKSGKFDSKVYARAWKDGSKFLGTKGIDKSKSYQLMEGIILSSFVFNRPLADRLIELGDVQFTHIQEKGFWRTGFPKALQNAQSKLFNNYEDYFGESWL